MEEKTTRKRVKGKEEKGMNGLGEKVKNMARIEERVKAERRRVGSRRGKGEKKKRVVEGEIKMR